MTELFTAKTISSSGSETTGTVDVDQKETLVIQIDGDSNSSDLDIVLQGKVIDDSSYSWSEMDSKANTDLTATANNSAVYSYDVEGLQTSQIKIDNNAASSTDVTVLEYSY